MDLISRSISPNQLILSKINLQSTKSAPECQIWVFHSLTFQSQRIINTKSMVLRSDFRSKVVQTTVPHLFFPTISNFLINFIKINESFTDFWVKNRYHHTTNRLKSISKFRLTINNKWLLKTMIYIQITQNNRFVNDQLRKNYRCSTRMYNHLKLVHIRSIYMRMNLRMDLIWSDYNSLDYGLGLNFEYANNE